MSYDLATTLNTLLTALQILYISARWRKRLYSTMLLTSKFEFLIAVKLYHICPRALHRFHILFRNIATSIAWKFYQKVNR